MKTQDGVLELFKRYLDAEEQSEKTMKLPTDTYQKLASHMQNLRRINNSNGDDLSSRFIRKQTKILESIVNQLLKTRLAKAIRTNSTDGLLPEEKYIYGVYTEFKKRETRFVNAIINGHPSFFKMAFKHEMSKKVIVRFLKPVGEIIGFDLKKYGPFKTHDLAVIPSGNAEVLIANGEASLV